MTRTSRPRKTANRSEFFSCTEKRLEPLTGSDTAIGIESSLNSLAPVLAFSECTWQSPEAK
jgi:hypothetical protein